MVKAPVQLFPEGLKLLLEEMGTISSVMLQYRPH